MDNLDQVKERVNAVLLPQLPNATAILVLGILSIVLCWCMGIVGIVLGIIGLTMGNKAIKLYKESPGSYSEASFKNVNAGRICSIIGLALGAIYVVYVIVAWSTYWAMISPYLNM